MTQQPTTEQRLTTLESKVAALEGFKHEQENRDIALLARIDGFINDLRRVERTQMRSFETVIAGQKNLEAEQKNQAARLDRVESNIVILVDIAKDHKQAIESLAGRIGRLEEGQQQLEIGQQQLEIGQQLLETGQQQLVTRMDRLEAGQQQLEAGQQQIIAILTGKSQLHD